MFSCFNKHFVGLCWSVCLPGWHAVWLLTGSQLVPLDLHLPSRALPASQHTSYYFQSVITVVYSDFLFPVGK